MNAVHTGVLPHLNIHIPIKLIDLTFQAHPSAQKLPIECPWNLYLEKLVVRARSDRQ